MSLATPGSRVAFRRGARRPHRRARDRQRRRRARGRPLGRAGGSQGRHRDQDDAAGQQLLEGAGRNPGGVRGGRLARPPCRGRHALVARHGRPGARRGAYLRGTRRDRMARGARLRVHPRERWLQAGPLRRRLTQAAPPGRRPDRPRDYEGAARGSRSGSRNRVGASPPDEPRAVGRRLARDVRDARRRRRDRRCNGRARLRRTVLRGGGDTRGAVHQPPQRDGRDDADRARRRRGGARPGRAPVSPERRRLARDDAGLFDPRDDARLRRSAPERRGRGVHGLARPARRRLTGDLRRGRGGTGHGDRGRTARGVARHDAHRRGRRRGLAPQHAPPVPRRGYRPAGRADPHVPGAALPKRRSRDRRRRPDDARGSLCVRRDRGRDARTEPHDGQQPARVRGLRATRRDGCIREGEGLSEMSTTAVGLEEAVLDAAARLYVWALKDIPQDLRDALAAASERETSVTGIRVLETIRRNVEIADEQQNLVCQDTGIAVYYCRVGERFPLHPAGIYRALKAGTERATVEHPLRSNTVHTLTRENTGANVGYRVPIVHWDFVPGWDGLDVKCVPKGSGSENMTFLKMLVPADGVAGIKRFVLDAIVGAGGKPCPPGIVGIGLGGSADYAMHLAKEAIARPVGSRNPDPLVAELEDELYHLLNETGIGPMGLGGDVTVLQCHIEHADTHMTLNPVAVNYQCWAARRASVHVDAQGNLEFDREF